MSEKQTEILFICGSPRSNASEALLALIEQGARDAGARSNKFLLSNKHINPCIGCGYCEKTGVCIQTLETYKGPKDDFLELEEALDNADALAIVAPLYFAGPAAQMKALYDRMQPFFTRKYLLDQKPRPKRPAQLFIVGGGGDPHGYEPMVIITRSSMAVAGFTVEKVQNFIGFKHFRDVASLPNEEEAKQMAFGELAHARKAIARQKEFEERAYAAGGAFARFVSKSKIKLELQAELLQVEEEMAELNSDSGSVDAPAAEDRIPTPVVLTDVSNYENDPSLQVLDMVDSDFEALKRSARASRATDAEKAAAEAKAILESSPAPLYPSGEDEAVEPEITVQADEVVDIKDEEVDEAAAEVIAENADPADVVAAEDEGAGAPEDPEEDATVPSAEADNPSE